MTRQLSDAESGRIYLLSGPINRESAKAAITALSTSEYSTIVITSAGGDEAAALNIADEIERRRVKVVAKGYCLSSCALYLLPASIGPARIEPGTLVAFHLNTPGILDVLPETIEGSRFEQEAIVVRERALALYERKKIAPNLFHDAVTMSDIRCFWYQRDGEDIVSVMGMADTRIWVPSSDYLARAGYEVDGAWPPDRASAEALVRHYLRPETSWRYGSTTDAQRPNTSLC